MAGFAMVAGPGVFSGDFPAGKASPIWLLDAGRTHYRARRALSLLFPSRGISDDQFSIQDYGLGGNVSRRSDLVEK